MAGSCPARAVKSVSWRVSCEMEETRVQERAFIKIAVLRERNAMLGVALGFVFSPLIVPADCSRKDLISIGKRNIAYILTAVNIAVFILITFTFQNAPKNPPSLAQAQKRKKSSESHTQIIMSMLKNPNFILILIVYDESESRRSTKRFMDIHPGAQRTQETKMQKSVDNPGYLAICLHHLSSCTCVATSTICAVTHFCPFPG
ncbi:putative MFS-type transporter C09D4.1 [Trichonephila clavipes]|nr:putative MFS-type transporter C09D4.1 [Trichonephila clavipes]